MPGSICDNIQLSEILANPAGDDASGEFIELYNPANYAQTLSGCSLQLATGKQYAFKLTDALEPHEYKTFGYTTTALQLSNSGGIVTLQTASAQTTTTYPAVGDDEVWAKVEGTWYVTHHPTPGLPNLLDTPSVSSAETTAFISNLVAELESCPAGKYRNPETNRCRSIGILETVPANCTVGQERNPATGRCRKIAAASTQTPCQQNQERNPETGRCRKVESAGTVQKPCEAGQERNAETNRCRKVATNPNSKVLGTSTTKPKTYHYVLVGIILISVMGYGVYEYRSSLSSIFSRSKRRVVP
jgi:hypothetical protein